MIKHCGGCNQDLVALDNFHKSKCQTDGYQSQCKKCLGAYAKKWGSENKERTRKRQRLAYAADPERHLKRKAKWRKDNPEKTKEITRRAAIKNGGKSQRKWNAKHPEQRRAISRNWYAKNREKAAKWGRDYRNASPARILHCRISARLRSLLRGGKGGEKTFLMLGYNLDTLKKHIERQFTAGMSWDNIGKWHIDHIVPLSSFEISSADDPNFRAAWELTNLRPLWAEENFSKKDKRVFLI